MFRPSEAVQLQINRFDLYNTEGNPRPPKTLGQKRKNHFTMYVILANTINCLVETVEIGAEFKS